MTSQRHSENRGDFTHLYNLVGGSFDRIRIMKASWVIYLSPLIWVGHLVIILARNVAVVNPRKTI